MWRWRLAKLAQFSKEGIPDVVFRFRDCIDCESIELLASFEFSREESRWKFRQWDPKAKPETGSYFMVGADMDTGETESGVSVLIETSCVYKVDDLNGSGVDEVGSWCGVTDTEMDPPGRRLSRKYTTLLFSVENGAGHTIEIKDSSAATELHRKLCSGQDQKPLCRGLTSGSNARSSRPSDH